MAKFRAESTHSTDIYCTHPASLVLKNDREKNNVIKGRKELQADPGKFAK